MISEAPSNFKLCDFYPISWIRKHCLLCNIQGASVSPASHLPTTFPRWIFQTPRNSLPAGQSFSRRLLLVSQATIELLSPQVLGACNTITQPCDCPFPGGSPCLCWPEGGRGIGSVSLQCTSHQHYSCRHHVLGKRYPFL